MLISSGTLVDLCYAAQGNTAAIVRELMKNGYELAFIIRELKNVDQIVQEVSDGDEEAKLKADNDL